MEDIEVTIRKRRLNYLGHTLRGGNEDGKTAMSRTPEGRRGKGRPKNTCRRVMEEDMRQAG